MFRSLAPTLVVLVACGARIGGGPDSGLNEELVDAGAPDAGLPRLGNHARVRGTCGLVAAQLTSTEPSYVEVNLDFANDGFDDPGERERLTAGARQILMEGTAGGSSGISEAFAYEVLELCEGASFVKSETTIVYDPPSSKKTDILVRIAGQKVGVSVTRAVAFPPDAGYPVTPQRVEFLEGKLDDILVSSANVVPADRWVKQLLLVMAYDQAHAQTLRTIWNGLDAMTRANTVLYVVVTDGDDRVVYFNP